MKTEFYRKFYKKKQETTGFELEEHYIGKNLKSFWESVYVKRGLRERGKELNLNQWIDLFEQKYPLNPKAPEKKWGIDILYSAAKELGLDLDDEDGIKELSFYNALGSGLDQRGIDCFLVYRNPKTKRRAFFTIDISKREAKDEWKADKVLHEFPDWRSKEDEYTEKMEEIAKEIAEKLRSKTELVH